MSKLSVSARLWLGFVFVAALPLFGLALTYERTFETTLVDTVASHLATIARKKAQEVEAYMHERVNDVGELARRQLIKDALEQHASSSPAANILSLPPKSAVELSELVEGFGYHDLLLISKTGRAVYSVKRESDLGTDLFQGPYKDTGLAKAFRQSANAGEPLPQFTPFNGYAPSGGANAAFVVSPVLRGKEILGFVALQLNFKRVAEVAADRTGLMSSGETVLAQRDGDSIAYMSELNWLDARPGTRIPLRETAQPMQEALQGKEGRGRVRDYAGRDCLAAWRYLPSLGWGMTVKIDAEEALRPATKLKTLTYVVFAGFLLLSALVAHLLGRTLSRPLRSLTTTVNRMAHGNLSERVTAAHGSAEFALLAASFNEMADKLQSSHEHLEAIVQARTAELEATNTRLQQDIGIRKQAEEKLRLYGEVFKQGGDAILLTDEENRIVDANPAFTALTGYQLEEVKGQNPSLLASGRTPPDVYASLWDSLTHKGFWFGEIWDKRKDGSLYPKMMSASVVRDENGTITNYIARFTDISDQKAIEARMEQLALFDGLTGLPNKFNLQQSLEQAITAAQSAKNKLAVAFIDLDRFKAVNDTLGHAVGDELLLRVAQRLQNCVRESDLVARFGGDEYVIVLPSQDNREAAVRVAEKVLARLREPYQIKGHRVHATPSIGIALYPDDGATAEELMRSADTAMYLAKAQGRNNAQFFTRELTSASMDRMNLECELREALARDQLTLHYQPKLDVRTGLITGVESLLRWSHPTLGFIPPSQFVAIAEDAGLISELGEWVMKKACRRLQTWKQMGLQSISMAINLSAHSLKSGDIVNQVTSVLAQCSLLPAELELEVTESAAMSDPGKCIEQLKALRDLGVRLAIDDFGTGYSSLNYLKLLPVHTLKLDRSFVKEIDSDSADLAICDATIALAHRLGLGVVAEGVETRKQRDLLIEHDCDSLQGYLICKPLEGEQAHAFIMGWNALNARAS